jgi:hypothetical protein
LNLARFPGEDLHHSAEQEGREDLQPFHL